MKKNIVWWKKLGSYFFPVLISKVNSQFSPDVELVLFHNQLMLTTPQAMYSYGVKYQPFVLAFDYLKNKNKLNPKQFLMLGGALLSALQILGYKYKIFPATTVVELDGKYKNIVMDYLPINITENIIYNHCNAEDFIASCTTKYNLIAIDIFIELEMPIFSLQENFLNNCKNCLQENGIVIMNTHFKNIENKNSFEHTFENIFTQMHIINHGRNYIFIGE